MLEQLTDQEFNEYAKNHPNNTFFQSSYWGDLKEFTGWKKHLLGLKEKGNIIGATLLLSKKIPVLSKNIFYAPRGFLINYQDQNMVLQFTKAIIHYTKKNKGIFFKINPYVVYQERNMDGCIVNNGTNNQKLVQYLKQIGYKHNGFTIHYGKDLEPRWVSVLNIKNKTTEEVLNSFRSSHKRKVKKSLSGWLSLEEITSNDKEKFDIFKQIMNHTGERRGYIDRTEDYYKKMYDAFSKDQKIKIVLVKLDLKKYEAVLNTDLEVFNKKISNTAIKDSEKQDLIQKINNIEQNLKEVLTIQETQGNTLYITAGVFLLFGTQVMYLFGGSYDQYMKYLGAYYMQWKVIEYAIENHYDYYNFYGITGEFEETSPMYGLFDFKRGFHADVVELIGEFTYVINKPYNMMYYGLFAVYKKLKKWRNHK